MAYRRQHRRGFGSTRGLGATAAQTAAWNAITCPAGFNKPVFNIADDYPASGLTANSVCVNRWSYSADQMKDPQTAALAASNDQKATQGYAMMAGGAGLVILGDGLLLKLVGVGLAAFGYIRSAFIGGM